MTSTRDRLNYPVNYRPDDDTNHQEDYLSQVRSDPNLHYLQQQLEQIDPATAHRLSHSGAIIGSDTSETTERVGHIIDALHTTEGQNQLDEKAVKDLTNSLADGMTAYHDRQREQLEFMSERSDYELPKTPRQEELDKFEANIQRAGLEYIKNDAGDITVTFPNDQIKSQILSTVPRGFARPVNKQELAEHKQNILEQRELNNTYVFKAEHEEEALRLQQSILADELDHRSKARHNEIASLLERVSGQPDPQDDDYIPQDQAAERIAELLHQQFEDDNKTLAERLAEVPVPDPAGDYNIDDINKFQDEDFRKRLLEMKVAYSFQEARESITENVDRLNAQDLGAETATDATHLVATIYYNTLKRMADSEDPVKFAAYQQQTIEVGQAVNDRILHGTSLLDGSDLELPDYTPPITDSDPDNFQEVDRFRTEFTQALADTGDLPGYLNLAANSLLKDLNTTHASYQQYLEDNDTPDDIVITNLNASASKTIAKMQWLLKD